MKRTLEQRLEGVDEEMSVIRSAVPWVEMWCAELHVTVKAV